MKHHAALFNGIAALMTLLGVGTQAADSPTSGAALYVTNEYSGDLTIIDAKTFAPIATVPLGKRPRGIKASPDGTTLYVALSGSPISPPGTDESKLPPPDKSADGIGIFDLKTREMKRVIKNISDPEQLAVSKDGKHLFVASEDSGSAVVIDIASGQTIATLPAGSEPEGVAVNPSGAEVYVTSEGGGIVTVIDSKKNTMIKQIKVGLRPRNTAFSSDGKRAYVTAEGDGSVTIIDAVKHEALDTIKAPELTLAMGIVVSHDDKTLYVTTGRTGKLIAIDVASKQIKGSVAVGARPWGLAISADGTHLYTANGPSNDVSVIDAKTLHVIQRAPAGNRPWGLAIAPSKWPRAL